MTIYWTGPFSTSDIPVGQRFNGWSNYNENSSTNALFDRYRDGDPVSAFIWRELYENVNLHYNQDMRPVWQDVWDGAGFSTGASGAQQTGGTTDWTDVNAIRCISPQIMAVRTWRRGAEAFGRLRVQLRMKTSSGVNEVTARVYSVATFAQCYQTWPAYADAATASMYAEFKTSSATYTSSPGWLDALTIDSPQFTEDTIVFADGREDVFLYTGFLVIATIENGFGTEGEVGAIQVHEEAPGG